MNPYIHYIRSPTFPIGCYKSCGKPNKSSSGHKKKKNVDMATVCCDYPKYFIIDGVLVFKNHYIHNILIALHCTIYKAITLMRKYYLCDMN